MKISDSNKIVQSMWIGDSLSRMEQIAISSFLANGSGARGTPTFFINKEFVVGYISIDRINALLNE